MRAALVLVVLLAATFSHAEEPTEDTRQAMKDRGIVLKAGKRHFLVLLPRAPRDPQDPDDAKLNHASAYFGTAKQLAQLTYFSWIHRDTDVEELGFGDSWRLFDAEVHRNGDDYAFECASNYDRGKASRTIKLTVPDLKTRTTLLESATIHAAPDVYKSYLLARMPAPQATTYVYVDHRGTGADYRVFMGKRGAMKPLAVKEIADDDEALIVVTVKGTLTVTKPGQTQTAAATFGSAQKPTALTLLGAHQNRGLIYRDLGVYTREAPGHPCYEL